MNKSLFQELYQTEKYSNKLSLNDEDIFPSIEPPQRANSDSTSLFNNNKNISFNQQIKNTSNISSNMQRDNPINQIQIEIENENLESSSETSKNNKNSIQSNKSNNLTPIPTPTPTTQNFLNSNFFGFKGRSPYSIPNLNNMINNNTNAKNNINKKNNTKKENNKPNKISQKNNTNTINKNQKKNDTALVTQLKDKILEYRCSVCNFVANEYEELHNHLIIKNHLILKKITKGKKKKYFYKKENKLNQTLMYSCKINKKNLEKKSFCKHCGKKFDSLYGLNAHLNAHKYKCEICLKLFNTKEELMKHNEMELYNIKKFDMCNKKNDFKSPGKKVKMEIDDWEEISSNKKEKYESDEDINKNDFEQSYVFIGDNDENFDFNKMIKINDKQI